MPKRKRDPGGGALCTPFGEGVLNQACPIHKCEVSQDTSQGLTRLHFQKLDMTVVIKTVAVNGGNDGRIHKATADCAQQTGIGIVKVRPVKEAPHHIADRPEGLDVHTEVYMHRVLSCLEKFAPELLLVGVDGDNNIYICMEGMEVTLHQFIYDNRRLDTQGYPGEVFGIQQIAVVLIAFFEKLKTCQTKYSFVHGDLHGDNIMIKTGIGGDPFAVLIDFGHSCRAAVGKIVDKIAPCPYPVVDDHDTRFLLLDSLLPNKENDQIGPDLWMWFLEEIEIEIEKLDEIEPIINADFMIRHLEKLLTDDYLSFLQNRYRDTDTDADTDTDTDTDTDA
jgi:hypothetical protein